MTASIGLPIVGGFYRTRNRFERPNHTYPEWEFIPLHKVTTDFLDWTSNVFATTPVRYDQASYRHSVNTVTLPNSIESIGIQSTDGAYRYDEPTYLETGTESVPFLGSLSIASVEGTPNSLKYSDDNYLVNVFDYVPFNSLETQSLL